MHKNNKKASMELSVNAIVILVIAVVVMGLILGFIKTQFNKVQILNTAPPAPQATSLEPVTLGSDLITVNAGDSMTVNINAFNPNSSQVCLTPTLTCAPAGLSPIAPTNKNITMGSQGTWSVTFPGTPNRGTYSCSFSVSFRAASCAGTATPVGSRDFTYIVK